MLTRRPARCARPSAGARLGRSLFAGAAALSVLLLSLSAAAQTRAWPMRHVDRDLVKYYKLALNSRKWKTGLLRTVRGTLEFTVRERMKELKAPTLLVTGERDRICDPITAAEAAKELPHGHFLSIPNCGHAPQIERHWLINHLVAHFLKSQRPTAHPRWTQLLKPGR